MTKFKRIKAIIDSASTANAKFENENLFSFLQLSKMCFSPLSQAPLLFGYFARPGTGTASSLFLTRKSLTCVVCSVKYGITS